MPRSKTTRFAWSGAMADAILVLNTGSSSLRFAIFKIAEPDLVLVTRGTVQGLGTSSSAAMFTAKDRWGGILVNVTIGANPTYRDAFAHLLRWMADTYGHELHAVAVGHCVIHGGADFV